MTRPDAVDADGDIVRAAMWLADIARWPEAPADLLIHRFDLKVWQARKAVEKAKRMQLLRRVNG